MSERLNGQELVGRVVDLFDFHLGRPLNPDEVELTAELVGRLEGVTPPAIELSDVEEAAMLEDDVPKDVVDAILAATAPGLEEVPSDSQLK